MLRLRIRQLVEGGVPRENILYLDLTDDRLCWLRHENPDIILEVYFELHPQNHGRETVHCFFDEVQALPHWQLFIDRLMRSEKCEVTVAGSLLPTPDEETASPLTGRIVSWEIFPLSFREFLDGKDIEINGSLSAKQRLTIQKAFEDYWQVGGFPGVNGLNQRQRIEAHQANWNTILASIIGHHNISHPRAVIDLAHWLVDNTGSFYAISHLTDYLKSLGHRVRKSSVVDWLVAFEDAGLLFSVNIFSSSPTRISVTPPQGLLHRPRLGGLNQLRHPHKSRQPAGESGVHRATPGDARDLLPQNQNGPRGGPCRAAAVSAGPRANHTAGPGLRLPGRPPRQAERGPLSFRSHGRTGGNGGDHRHLAHR